MKKIIKIQQEKCVGCGLCIAACQESALALVDGKAKLVREDYCDGLGNCLPVCPMDAISFVEQEENPSILNEGGRPECSSLLPSFLEEKKQVWQNWPVQLKLAPMKASYFEGAHLLIGADCTAFCYDQFSKLRFGKVVLIGCPKLDEGGYAEKLQQIISANNICKITLVRMEVPCCGGLERSLKEGLAKSGKSLPLEVMTITTQGKIK